MAIYSSWMDNSCAGLATTLLGRPLRTVCVQRCFSPALMTSMWMEPRHFWADLCKRLILNVSSPGSREDITEPRQRRLQYSADRQRPYWQRMSNNRQKHAVKQTVAKAFMRSCQMSITRCWAVSSWKTVNSSGLTEPNQT
jgi:hypothetical protein